MRALDLDFVRRKPAWPAWLLLAVGIGIAGDALLGWLALRDELGQLQRRRGVPQLSATLAKEPVDEQTQRELDAARQVLQELALPWEPLFLAIEGAIDADTALLSVEPDAGKRIVRIGGEARHYLAILNFIQRLEASQGLSGVHLLNHQVREEVAERPLQFMLAASWKAVP